MDILEQLRPFGSLTTYESNAGKPEIRPDHSESRLAFANLCLVSKWIRPYAIRHLYHTVLLKDQKELLYFFRTIANNHDLRSTIRSFAWAGVLSTDDANLDSTRRQEKEMDCLAPECWASIDWPSSPIDFDIARLMGIDGPETLQSWRVLGAVLAMIPSIRSLFVLLAHMPITPPRLPPCPEMDAIWALIWPPKSNSYQFLQELRTITLEPHHNARTACWLTEKSLMALLVNSPLVYRVELKGTLYFRSMQRHTQKFWDFQIVSESVKELLRFRARHPQEDMTALTTIFPKLVSLEAEYVDGSRREFDDLDETVSGALFNVSGTLENLSLTTSLGQCWDKGDELPQLSNLKQMAALKHLTTESIWLFGRGDSFTALHLPDILPRSLVSFHLIDYWGSSDTDPPHPPHPPQFPNTLSLLGFYNQTFLGLYESCLTQLPNLKEITLASDSLSSHTTTASGGNTAATVDGSNGQSQPADACAFLHKFQNLFASVGVRFSVLTPEISQAELQSSWANVG